MKKYKTSEEFVLDELYKTQEQLENANIKIAELEQQLDAPIEEEVIKTAKNYLKNYAKDFEEKDSDKE